MFVSYISNFPNIPNSCEMPISAAAALFRLARHPARIRFSFHPLTFLGGQK